MMAYTEKKHQCNHVEDVTISFVYKQNIDMVHSIEVDGNNA